MNFLILGALVQVDFLAWPSAEMCRGFMLSIIWRIFPGIVLEDFSGHLFPQEYDEKASATTSAKKSGGSEIKIRDKTVLPETDPNILRGPAAILFISRNTCSDSIAKLFRACFYGVSHNYRGIRCKMGYRIAPFWGSAHLPQKVSRDMGYRSDSIAALHDMGPLMG